MANITRQLIDEEDEAALVALFRQTKTLKAKLDAIAGRQVQQFRRKGGCGRKFDSLPFSRFCSPRCAHCDAAAATFFVLACTHAVPSLYPPRASLECYPSITNSRYLSFLSFFFLLLFFFSTTHPHAHANSRTQNSRDVSNKGLLFHLGSLESRRRRSVLSALLVSCHGRSSCRDKASVLKCSMHTGLPT